MINISMDSIDSDDSNSNRFEIRVNHRTNALSSPLTRKRDDDDDEEEVSDKEAKLIRRKRAKRTTVASPAPTLDSSSPAPKIAWTKDHELLILKGIVEYEDETNLSYRSDWDAFYGFIKGSIEATFTKVQLRSKIRKLKKRFTDKLANSGDGEGPSFVSTHDHETFKLSMAIWGKGDETACDSNVNTDVTNLEHEQITQNVENVEQGKITEDVTYAEHEQQITEDVEHAEDETNEEHEQITQIVEQGEDMTNADHEQVTQMLEQGEEDWTNAEHDQITENVEQAENVTNVEHEQITENLEQAEVENGENVEQPKVDNGENVEISEKVGVEEFCVLQDAFEAMVFPTVGKLHQKLLLQNLKNLEAEKGKELSEEWKALIVEEMKLKIKKLSYSAKLTEASA